MIAGEHVFGGILIAQEVARPLGMSAELLPDTILTLSDHLAPHLPAAWLIDWVDFAEEERARRAASMEIGERELAALRGLVGRALSAGHIGFPGVILERSLVEEVLACLPAHRPWIVVELGLSPHHVPAFLSDNAPAQGIGAGGVYEAVCRATPVAADGVLLGFELLCANAGSLDCSWLCNALDQECWRELGVRPGPLGLLADEEDAERAARHIADPAVGAEPGQWLPWRLARLPR